MGQSFYLRSIAVLCLVWHSHTSIFSQPNGFSRTYLFDERSTIFHAVRQQGEQLIILGQVGGDSLGNNGVFVALVDTFGEVGKLKLFQDPLGLNSLNLSTFSCESITVEQDAGILFAGATRFSKNIFLIKLNEDLELDFYREYDGGFLFRYVNFVISHLEAYYCIGLAQTQNKDFDVFVIKTDLDGNRIWERTYGSPQLNENGSSAILESNGITIMANEWYDPDPFQYDDQNSWNTSFHIDTSGEVVWKWKGILNEEGASPEAFLKFGSDYIYTTHPGVQPSMQTIHYSPQVVCRDSLFNLNWRRNYGDYFHLNWFSDLKMGPDSFLYAAGYIPEDVTWGRVCKIDPENGDLIWDARDTAFHIEGWGSRNRMEGLTVLPSGSIIAVGYTMDYSFRENGLLYKVTKDGCIDTLCLSVSIDELLDKPDRRVTVYPNPTVESIVVNVGEYVGLCISIYNLQGQQVHHEDLSQGDTQVDIGKTIILKGMYVWLVTDRTGQVLDSGKLMVVPD